MGIYCQVLALVMVLLLPLSLSACPNIEKINSRKNLADIYRELRREKSNCSAESYITFSSQALLAGRLAESLWSTTTGLKLATLTPRQQQHLHLLHGKVYHELGRQEEAIIYLRKAAFLDKGSVELAQQSHLLLIKVYFTKAGNTKDANVRYLTNLFRSRYPESPYLTGLLSWLQNPT